MSIRPWSDRLMRTTRRALFTLVGLQLVIAVTLTLVDSYRRRNRKPKPFPVTAPIEVPVGGGTVTTYTYGQDLYEDMLMAIESAKQRILFETYIWKDDEIGQRFKSALIQASRRGVDVHVIYDGFANLVVPPTFKRFPADIKVLRFPVYNAGVRFFDLRHYGRDHRKILVVDDEVGFVGGYNIGSAYATEWRDTHCRITGPGVWDLQRAFADFWNLHRKRRFRGGERPLLLQTASEWEPSMRFHRNIPTLWSFPIRSMYLEAINRANSHVWMTHAYFIADPNFVETLREAAGRGVDVRILLPRKSNHIVADWISRGYFASMLEAGIRIFRYRDAMVHAKTATIDGSWSTIGTANVDRLSMQGNYEINVEFIDRDQAKAMETIFENDLSNCAELTMDEWESRDIYRRFTEAILGPLRPLL